MNFRNENNNLGLGTTVQELSGSAGNPAGAPTVSNLKPVSRIYVDIPVSAVNLTATNVAGWVFRAPVACQVLAINAVAATPASSSMTIQLTKMPLASQPAAPSGTGNQVLTAAALNLDTGLVANTVLAVGLATTAANLVLAAGDLIGFTASGAATGLIGGNIQVELQQLS